MPKCCATELISLIVITRIFDDLFSLSLSLCFCSPYSAFRRQHAPFNARTDSISHIIILRKSMAIVVVVFVSFIILAPNNLSKNNSDAMRKHCQNYGQTMGIIGWTHFEHSVRDLDCCWRRKFSANQSQFDAQTH